MNVKQDYCVFVFICHMCDSTNSMLAPPFLLLHHFYHVNLTKHKHIVQILQLFL